MKNKTKKVLSAVLCCSMLVAITGCGVQKPESKKTTEASGGGTSVLRVGVARDTSFAYQGDETAENNAWRDLYRENGIELEVMYEVDLSQKTEKLAQCIMADDYPDLLQVSADNFNEWATQGLFADLTEGFEQYASDELKEYYSSEAGQRALQACTIDGKLYGIPGINTPNDGMPILWIRKDWLDNLELEIPQTVDELYEVAKAFSENDPDQNGKDDTYGIALNGKDVFQQFGDFGTFFEMFGAQPGYFSGKVPFIDVNGEAVYGGTKVDEMKQGLELLRKMYQEDIISKDFVIAGNDQIMQDMAAGKVGMSFNIFWGAEAPWRDALETQPNAEFVSAAIPGLTAENRGQAFYTVAPGECYAMNVNCDNMEAFFTALNLGVHYLGRPDKLSQEEYEMYNGLPGKYTGSNLAIAALGMPFKNMNAYTALQEAFQSKDTSKLNAENFRDYNAMMVYYDNRDRREELTEEELASFNAGVLYWSVWGADHCAYQTLHEMDDIGNYLYSTYDAPLTEKMNECTTSLITLTKETIIDIVIGNKSVEDYDAFLQQWNALGGEEITKEANEWYQSTK